MHPMDESVEWNKPNTESMILIIQNSKPDKTDLW